MDITRSGKVKGVNRIRASGAERAPDQECREVLVMAHPDNTDRVYVMPHEAASKYNGLPLKASEHIQFSVDNLNELYFYFESMDEVIILYTN